MSIKLTKTLMAVAAGSLLASAASAFDVVATVSSTISVTETTALSLGSVYVTGAASGATGATLIMNTDGTIGGADGDGAGSTVASKFVALGGQQVGTVSVSGAAAFGTVTVDSSATPVDLSHSSGSPSIPDISFTALVTDPADGDPLTLDAAGAGDILVGGTFTAEISTSATITPYSDGDYTGSYDVTVAY